VLRHDPSWQLNSARETLAACQSRLDHALDRALSSRRSQWTNLRGQLHSLSPLAVLNRGYALVQDENGVLVRSASQVAIGQTVKTRLGDGVFSSNVTATIPDKKKLRKTEKDRSTSK
jgi:exodeoxyribonuclease VII large subunit